MRAGCSSSRDASASAWTALVARQEQIRRLAAQNPSFTGDLLRTELMKTDRLVDAFIEMAVTCARYELTSNRSTRRAGKGPTRWDGNREGAARPATPKPTIAKKNLAIVLKRLDKMQEIQRYLSVARGQLDLIENSFQFIADQIVTMQSPQELSGQLDELLDGVEAIRQTAHDTETDPRHRSGERDDRLTDRDALLPAWAEDLRRRYLRGEASMFVLHGNVYDVVLYGAEDASRYRISSPSVLLKDTQGNRSPSTTWRRACVSRSRAAGVTGLDDLVLGDEKDRVLAALERCSSASTETAVDHGVRGGDRAHGDPAFQGDADRAAIVTLHRWSFLPEIEKGDNVVLLIAENLTDLSPKLVSNPKVAVVEVPMPDLATRRAAATGRPAPVAKDADRYAERDGRAEGDPDRVDPVAPPPPRGRRADARERFITGLLGGGSDAAERAHKLAALTVIMTRDEIKAAGRARRRPA